MLMDSENLAREWALDPQASEIWDGLRLIEREPMAGLEALESLGRSGSALSMMYAGHACISGEYGVNIDMMRGEAWLKGAHAGGSIEGGYRLAKHLQSLQRHEEAVEVYLELSKGGYAPASYQLGVEYYLGEVVDRDINKAIHYLNVASMEGHFPSIYWKSYIRTRLARGVLKRLAIYFGRVVYLIPMLYYTTRFPRSDRLRR